MLTKYLRDAIDKALDKVSGEAGWIYAEPAFEELVKSLDNETLELLASSWMPRTLRSRPSEAVEHVVEKLAKVLLLAVDILEKSGVDLHRVDWVAIDWRTALEELADIDPRNTAAMARKIAGLAAEQAAVPLTDVDRGLEASIDVMSEQVSQQIDMLSQLLRDISDGLEELRRHRVPTYEMLRERFLKAVEAVAERGEKAAEKVEEAHETAFAGEMAEAVKMLREAVGDLKKAVEDVKRLAEEVAKGVEEARKEKRVEVRIKVYGETAAENIYLERILIDFTALGGGYDPVSGEFLAPLTAIWSLAKRNYGAYPDLFRAIKMWLALNRALYNRVFGFSWGFIRIDENEPEWLSRAEQIHSIAMRKSPDVMDMLRDIEREADVPRYLYSLLDGAIYRATRTAYGVIKGEPVPVKELEKIAREVARAPWLKTVAVWISPPIGRPYIVELTIPSTDYLKKAIKGVCQICGASRFSEKELYSPAAASWAYRSVLTCENCLTNYVIYGDGSIEVQIPTRDTELWRGLWERNPRKDPTKPFAAKWIDNAEKLRGRGWRITSIT